MKHRIVAQSVGEVATGKTTFWLGAPGPMVIQTLDQGLEGVVEPFAVKKAIYLASYDLVGKMGSNGFTHALAVEARDKFITDFEHAIGVARTIIWDRGSDVFDLFYFAEFGTDDAFAAAPPKDWDRLKGKIRRLIAMAKASEINFGIIEGMKNEWLSKVNPKTGSKAAVQSGNRIPAGMEGIDGLVHIVLNHTREGKAFNLTVEKSRGPGGGDIQDQTFENLTFVDMAQLVFPGSSESEWT
jgi:hypothetical protein